MPEIHASTTTFALLARQVSRRVVQRRWLKLLALTFWPIAVAEAFLIGWQLAANSAGVSRLAWVLLTMWLGGTWGLAWWRRPNTFSALALWDHAAGRREAFATAWWFIQQPARSRAEQEHVDKQTALVAAALPDLHRDLPLSPKPRLAAAPALALLATLVAVVSTHDRHSLIVDPQMAKVATEEARKIAATAWDKKKLAGLTPEEQKDLQKLKETLKQTAQDLESTTGKGARDVLSNLEKRAREAEKLAQRMELDKDAWASESLIAELRRQADTADLGDAVAAKNAAAAANAAETLSQQLKSPRLTEEARERFAESLHSAQERAEQEDRQRVVGQHVLAAGDQLQRDQPEPAGKEFETLAEKMRDLARREQTRKELEKLAQQLRDAGSKVAGQTAAGGMQEMAGNDQQGQSGQTPQTGQAPQVGQAQPGSNNQSQPVLQQPGSEQGQSMTMAPGTGQQQSMMMAQGRPGQQGEGQPMLLAPVPGMKPGEQPSAFMLSPPGQQQPADGPMMMLNVREGNKPGVGKADLNADPTAKQASGNQSVVTAQSANEGQSTVRAVEGGARKEATTRTDSEVAVDFIEAEESALDEAALPPSRREQVRRYFTELRKRFQKTE